ncbi:MAG: hypothetical protein ACP5LA_06280 [Thermoplasmata archaeon]
MVENKITKNQIEYIKKLEKGNEERGQKIKQFLKDKNKNSIEELTIKEASELIELIKKIKSDNMGDLYATGKQISFIENLQKNEHAEKLTENFLKNKNKETVNFLTMQEASELINELKKIIDKDGIQKERKITEKQLNYLKKLLKTEEKKELAYKFLTALNKNSIEDLTSKEASLLIDKLK